MPETLSRINKLVVEGPQPFTADLSASDLAIGRSMNCDVVLPDEELRVSRRHARLTFDADHGQWWVEDLGSRNGTLVDGQAVSRAPLHPGQVVTVGPYHLYLSGQRDVGSGAQTLVDRKPSTTTFDLPSEITEATRGRAGGAESLEGQELALFQSLIRELASMGSVGEVRSRACQMLVERLGLTVAALIRVHEAEDEQVEAEVLSSSGQSPLWQQAGQEQVRVSRSLIRAVLNESVPMIASAGGEVPGSIELSIDTTSSEVVGAAIVEAGGSDSELLYLIAPRDYAQRRFADFLGTLAIQVGQSLRAVRQAGIGRELELAQQVQQRFLPRPSLCFDPLLVEMSYRPCYAVGGDLVDCWSGPDGRVGAVLADVSGKGLAAALVAANLQASFRAGSAAGGSLEEIVEATNRYLLEHTPDSVFATMFTFFIDPGSGRMEWINAGHPPPIHMDRGKGTAAFLEAEPAFPIGIAEERYSAHSLVLEPGQSLLVMTDGITEATDPQRRQLGTGGVLRWVRGWLDEHGADWPVKELVRSLNAHCQSHTANAEPDDDRTVLLLAHEPGQGS